MTSTFDDRVETFRLSGLSPQAAVVAAIGRDHRTEGEARAYYERYDRLQEAERRAAEALLAPTAPAAPGLDAETLQVAEAARTRLGMPIDEARQYAVHLREREVRRGGAEHARRWQTAFAVALAEPVQASA